MVLICILAVLTAISLTVTVVAYRIPTVVTLHRVYAELIQISNFTYLARVAPSMTYGNRTVIGIGEPLYTNLVKDIELNMSYRIASARPIKRVAGIYSWTITLLSEAGWSKVLSTKRGLRFTGPGFVESFKVDVRDVKRIIRRIEAETGLRSLRYAIRINVSIDASVTLYNGMIVRLSFKPHTSIDVEKGKMSIAPLSMSANKKLESVETLTNYIMTPLGRIEVASLRNTASLSSIASISTLAFLIIVASRRHTRKLIDRVYRERLVIGSRSLVHMGSVIEIRRIEDLRKVADILDKPIVRIADGGLIKYCVFDSTYIYCLLEQDGVRDETKAF